MQGRRMGVKAWQFIFCTRPGKARLSRLFVLYASSLLVLHIYIFSPVVNRILPQLQIFELVSRQCCVWGDFLALVLCIMKWNCGCGQKRKPFSTSDVFCSLSYHKAGESIDYENESKTKLFFSFIDMDTLSQTLISYVQHSRLVTMSGESSFIMNRNISSLIVQIKGDYNCV